MPCKRPPMKYMFCVSITVNSDEEKDNIIIALSVVVVVSFISMATMVICLIRIKAKQTQGIPSYGFSSQNIFPSSC